MSRPIAAPKKEVSFMALLEGAAILQESSNRIQAALDSGKGPTCTVGRTELQSIQKINHHSARTMDEILYALEWQQEQIKNLKKIIDVLKSQND